MRISPQRMNKPRCTCSTPWGLPMQSRWSLANADFTSRPMPTPRHGSSYTTNESTNSRTGTHQLRDELNGEGKGRTSMNGAMLMTLLLLCARVLLCTIFLVAGFAKLADLAGSRAALRNFGVPAALASPFGIL